MCFEKLSKEMKAKVKDRVATTLSEVTPADLCGTTIDSLTPPALGISPDDVTPRIVHVQVSSLSHDLLMMLTFNPVKSCSQCSWRPYTEAVPEGTY